MQQYKANSFSPDRKETFAIFKVLCMQSHCDTTCRVTLSL